MTDLIKLLGAEKGLFGYRIVTKKTKSHEWFFVHEKLETVRATDTEKAEVTVYVAHDGKLGDSTFTVCPADAEEETREKLRLAVSRAKLVNNRPYELVEGGKLETDLPTDLSGYDPKELGLLIARAVFDTEEPPRVTVNALEIFLYREETRVQNSRGVDKKQTKYRVMLEAIPTYTDETGSVELYEDFRFTRFDPEEVTREIRERMREVKDRARARKPDAPLPGRVVLRPREICALIEELAEDQDYATVYAKAGLHAKGDLWQKDRTGDPLTLVMTPKIEGSEKSADFDEDGTDLSDVLLIENGVAKNYFGSNRFGQYLGEKPTGVVACGRLACGTLTEKELNGEPYLELMSLSGLQVDLFSDYVGGEIRLAYLVEGGKRTPVTGISFSACLSKCLSGVRLWQSAVRCENFEVPERMLFTDVTVL